MRALLFLVCAPLCCACQPSLGDCSDDDRALAHTLVYDSTGTPAYAGQAIMIGSCAGGGSACHSETALTRYGTPYDLNFDPLLADDPSFEGDERAGAAHLYGAQVRIHRKREDIFHAIYDESMPPGDIGEEMTIPYFTSDGETMPGIETAEGLELVRAWLACGVPVIEATSAIAPRPCTANDECSPLALCNVDVGTCVNVGNVAAPR